MEARVDNRRVVMIKGDKSKGYEQAIFILEAGTAEAKIDFVREAERIVGSRAFSGKTRALSGRVINRADYAKAEMLPTGTSVGASTSGGTTVVRKVRKRNRFDVMLNFALVAVGLAVVFLFFLNLT